ncbi:hypothetical protein AAC978_08040 [Desulfitobacterium sp. THU1]
MKSGQVIGGIVAGSILGMSVGYMMRPKNKTLSMMRKGMKMMKF